ncbi:MAG: hypothetical protein Q9221_003050 [Calogaya cf. arnoldii]
MPIHSIASAAAQSKVTDLGKLVTVRKSIIGADLPVDTPDQIIAKAIEDIWTRADAGHFYGTMPLLLEKLSGIRTDMIWLDVDGIGGVDGLIEHAIGTTCAAMQISREVSAKFDWAVPLAMYTTLSEVLIRKPPTRCLQLVITQENPKEGPVFCLFEGTTNLRSSNPLLGFSKDGVYTQTWSQSCNMICLVFNPGSPRGSSGAVYLEMPNGRVARSYLDRMSRPEPYPGRPSSIGSGSFGVSCVTRDLAEWWLVAAHDDRDGNKIHFLRYGSSGEANWSRSWTISDMEILWSSVDNRMRLCKYNTKPGQDVYHSNQIFFPDLPNTATFLEFLNSADALKFIGKMSTIGMLRSVEHVTQYAFHLKDPTESKHHGPQNMR